MTDGRRLLRISALVVALVGGLLLVVGVYAVMAGPAPTAGPATGSPNRPSSVVGWTRWVSITPGLCQVFTHSLGVGPEDYSVELLFLDTGGMGLNRHGYGGLEFNGSFQGVAWQNLTSNTIEVCRLANDFAADRIHIRITIPSDPPDYASPWLNINPGQTLTLTHGLGITATDLTVALWFSGTSRGIHHIGYGGAAVDTLQLLTGGHWHHLTDNTVQVTRHPDEFFIDQVRVIVVRGATPAYDSLVDLGGWQSIAVGDRYTFTHGLSWDPTTLLVRGECSSTLGGINQWFAGGNHDWFQGWQGTYLRNLTNNAVTTYRHANDQVCDQVRVRIWKRERRTYLPLVLMDYS